MLHAYRHSLACGHYIHIIPTNNIYSVKGSSRLLYSHVIIYDNDDSVQFSYLTQKRNRKRKSIVFEKIKGMKDCKTEQLFI